MPGRASAVVASQLGERGPIHALTARAPSFRGGDATCRGVPLAQSGLGASIWTDRRFGPVCWRRRSPGGISHRRSSGFGRLLGSGECRSVSLLSKAAACPPWIQFRKARCRGAAPFEGLSCSPVGPIRHSLQRRSTACRGPCPEAAMFGCDPTCPAHSAPQRGSATGGRRGSTWPPSAADHAWSWQGPDACPRRSRSSGGSGCSGIVWLGRNRTLRCRPTSTETIAAVSSGSRFPSALGCLYKPAGCAGRAFARPRGRLWNPSPGSKSATTRSR